MKDENGYLVCDGIKAFISEEDAFVLRRWSSRVTGNGKCLEIGCGQGASTVEIAKHLPDGKELICSSLFGGEYEIFKSYCVRSGVWNKMLPVTGDFRNLLNYVLIPSLSFVFIDHDHTEEGMRDTLNMILPLCENNCLILFHDYKNSGYPAVESYVSSLVLPDYELMEVDASIAVVRAIRNQL